FLADVQVQETLNLAGGVQLGGLLLETANQQHLAEQSQGVLRRRGRGRFARQSCHDQIPSPQPVKPVPRAGPAESIARSSNQSRRRPSARTSVPSMAPLAIPSSM